MKLLKTIGLILLVLILLVVVLMFIAPTELKVEKSTVIKSSVTNIFPQVVSLKERETWSDWNRQFDDMTTEIEGKDRTVGAKAVWTSEKGGNGSQEITAIVPNERVETKLQFEGRGDADSYLTLEKVEDGTKVTWGLTSPTPRPFNIPLLFSDFGVGEGYEKSLGHLKEKIENRIASAQKAIADKPKIEVVEVDFPATTFAAKREKIRMAYAYGFMREQLPALQEEMSKNNVTATGNTTRLIYNWNEQKGEAELAIAIPANGSSSLSGDYSSISIAGRKALLLEYYGDFATVKSARKIIELYMKANKLKQYGPVIEEYVTNPEEEPDPSKWLTKVYYLLQ